jgi:uncharacterized membrane protein
MALLILGLVIFLGVHSLRALAGPWRTRQRERLGALRWKVLIAVASLAGFVLLVWGFGLARAAPVQLWSPPPWTRHVTGLLMLPAFILLVAAYLPGTHIKAAIGHPMTAAVKTWALAHLLANGTLADVVLFGSFLAWSVVTFSAARRIDRAAGTRYPAQGAARDIAAVVLGALAWAWFAHYGHLWLIGVNPIA